MSEKDSSDKSASARVKKKRVRGPGRPFPKGVSGNPKGRRRRDSVIDAFMEEVIFAKDGTQVERRTALIQRLYASAMDTTRRDHPKLLELAVSYYFGKPRERVEMSGPDGGPIKSEDTTPARRRTTGELRKRWNDLVAKVDAHRARTAATTETNGHSNGASDPAEPGGASGGDAE